MRNVFAGVLAGAIFISLVCVVVSLPWNSQPIGPENYNRIGLGMSREEIEKIIGMPPGIYTTHPMSVGHAVTAEGPWGGLISEIGRPRSTIQKERGPKGRVSKWWGEHYAIEVAFDEQGLAVGCYLLEILRP